MHQASIAEQNERQTKTYIHTTYGAVHRFETFCNDLDSLDCLCDL